MASTSSSHRGHEIVTSDVASKPQLTIDGEAVQVSQISENLYATLLLPHSNFSSLDDLAKAVINYTPQFSGRRDIT
jgi:hypothetical protein